MPDIYRSYTQATAESGHRVCTAATCYCPLRTVIVSLRSAVSTHIIATPSPGTHTFNTNSTPTVHCTLSALLLVPNEVKKEGVTKKTAVWCDARICVSAAPWSPATITLSQRRALGTMGVRQACRGGRGGVVEHTQLVWWRYRRDNRRTSRSPEGQKTKNGHS